MNLTLTGLLLVAIVSFLIHLVTTNHPYYDYWVSDKTAILTKFVGFIAALSFLGLSFWVLLTKTSC